MSVRGTEQTLSEVFDKELQRLFPPKPERALDELFNLARKYNTTESYNDLLKFIRRFRFYSPYNAMLIHMQMPGAKFVATPRRWLDRYKRRIKTGARPLMILQPRGPVMFVFDVSDTEPQNGAPPLPSEVDQPFEVRSGHVGRELELTYENAKRDGINIIDQDAGSQRAGSIQTSISSRSLKVLKKSKPVLEYEQVPLRYEMLLNTKLSREARYATLAHELGHLYCGHLGSPNLNWWPNRQTLDSNVCEFEAESVCYLACGHIGVDNPSEQYLSGYMDKNKETPPISLEAIMKAAGLIQKMGQERLKLRKPEA
jgi:hypothetical protein